ncbi:MAG TPA: hypothetical protein P5075_07100, partial [Eubacteriales bacterium]|nr:hypothetical protein [Eubacteriales bacterium]
ALHWQCRDHRFESGKLHQDKKDVPFKASFFFFPFPFCFKSEVGKEKYTVIGFISSAMPPCPENVRKIQNALAKKLPAPPFVRISVLSPCGIVHFYL